MKKLIIIILLLSLLWSCGSSEPKPKDDPDIGTHMMIVQNYFEKALNVADPDVVLGDFVVVKVNEEVKTTDGKQFEHGYIVEGNLKKDGMLLPFYGVTAVDDPQNVNNYYVLQFVCRDLNHEYDVIAED